jgi:PEGA domain
MLTNRLAISCALLLASSAFAQSNPTPPMDSQKTVIESEKPRVFITDSQSWQTTSAGGGSSGAFAGASSGGARPQTAEIIKTFGERCPQVMVNNIQQKANYIVLLDHEGGKSLLSHHNKVAVFQRVAGDSIVSKSTISLGASVQDACEAINKDWVEHGSAMLAAAAAAETKSAPTSPVATATATPTSTAKLSVGSVPDGADIEVDGNFAGNTPSEIDVPAGDHTLSIKKSGFKDWTKNIKISAGSNIHVHPELEKNGTQ